MGAHLSILRHGPLLTVQDQGRYGYRSRGISTSGAMDRDSLAIANALVGNEQNAAAIEFAAGGGAMTVDEDVLVAVTGGRCTIKIGIKTVAPWESHFLRAGETLSIEPLQGAVWGYVAFSGGITIPPILGSRSTHLRTGIGGLDGKTLSSGDILPLGSSSHRTLLALGKPYLRRSSPIRIVPGPQDDYFDESVWRAFVTHPFQITASRDRMAMVLQGPPLPAFKGHDIVSDATVTGSIQVPGSGMPIVLMADAQTTGGYPKIATVASVDLPRLAQIPSGRTVTFHAISADQSEDLQVEEQKRLSDLIGSLVLGTEKRFWEF